MIEWLDVEGNASFPSIYFVSAKSGAILQSCATFLLSRDEWLVDGLEPTDSEWNDIENDLSIAVYEIMAGLTGLILPGVVADTSGLGLLPCDGTQYLRTDYPGLYAKIDSTYHVDADNFVVPDMRDKTVIGAGSTYDVDDTGGNATHTLSESELPSHNHSYNLPTSNIDVESVGIPDPTGVGIPFLPVSTGNTGGDNSHNNMQPYIAVDWYIVT